MITWQEGQREKTISPSSQYKQRAVFKVHCGLSISILFTQQVKSLCGAQRSEAAA